MFAMFVPVLSGLGVALLNSGISYLSGVDYTQFGVPAFVSGAIAMGLHYLPSPFKA